MERSRLAQAPDEYGRLFQFFFVFRGIALIIGLIWILVRLSYGENHTPGLVIWAGVLSYTIILYAKRREVFTLLLRHPAFLNIDILISILLLMTYNTIYSPFWFYSISPVIPAAVLFRFKGATLSSILLSIGSVVSVVLHVGTVRATLSPMHFPPLFGQIAAYFTVGYMCIYPADMISEIVRQRSLIKEQAEKAAVSEERARLSRELHDNLAQMLSVIKFKADGLSESSSNPAPSEIRELTSSALQDLRNAIFALRPENTEQNLDQILADFCTRFSSTRGCKIDIHVGIDGADFSAEQKYEILRICQEALTNASRHSGESTVRLEAKKANHLVTLSIEDKGIGFDPPSVSKGVGISSMRERAAKLGATLEIDSAPGRGTSVKLRLPLELERRLP